MVKRSDSVNQSAKKMKKSCCLFFVLFICAGHSFSQEYIPIDPRLNQRQDELLNQQAEIMLNKADEVLSNFPPQFPEPLERTMALYLLDCIFHDVYAPLRPPDVWKDKPFYEKLRHLDRDANKRHTLPVQSGRKEVKTTVYPGHQGDYLNNVVVVYTPEGLCFSHNGDQNAGQIAEDTLWFFDIRNQHQMDVLMYNAYMSPAWIKGFDPVLVISAHENVLGHGIHSRHPFC